MKTFKLIVGFSILLGTAALFKSCHSGPYELTTFLIKVDSIRIPSVITSNLPFDIEFYGTIGTNGCYDFLDFFQTSYNNEITIEAWGTLDSNANVCPTVMVYLDGRKKSVTIPTPGSYVIRIKQPRSIDIQKPIIVN
jgi:hypothetical protein